MKTRISIVHINTTYLVELRVIIFTSEAVGILHEMYYPQEIIDTIVHMVIHIVIRPSKESILVIVMWKDVEIPSCPVIKDISIILSRPRLELRYTHNLNMRLLVASFHF